MFGQHLMLDCEAKTLLSKEWTEEFLLGLAKTIGMTVIAGPVTIGYKGGQGFDKGGVSSVLIVAESHISIHSFPNYEFATVDIYSCKEFDTTAIKKHVVKEIGTNKIEVQQVSRGGLFGMQA